MFLIYVFIKLQIVVHSGDRSSRGELFYEKVDLKSCAKFTGKSLNGVLL